MCVCTLRDSQEMLLMLSYPTRKVTLKPQTRKHTDTVNIDSPSVGAGGLCTGGGPFLTISAQFVGKTASDPSTMRNPGFPSLHKERFHAEHGRSSYAHFTSKSHDEPTCGKKHRKMTVMKAKTARPPCLRGPGSATITISPTTSTGPFTCATMPRRHVAEGNPLMNCESYARKLANVTQAQPSVRVTGHWWMCQSLVTTTLSTRHGYWHMPRA